MAGARKCPSCGRWVKHDRSYCGTACERVACPHRLQVWTWIGDKLRPWTQLYAPRLVVCETNHRTHPGRPHWNRIAGAWT